MHNAKQSLYWSLDAVIAILFGILLWRLYAPISPTVVPPIQEIESQSITIEALIREIHSHAAQLPEAKRRLLFEELEQATLERDKLLELMESSYQIDQELTEIALQIWSRLSPEQRESLRRNRNRISVDTIERLYWEEALKNLEEIK